MIEICSPLEIWSFFKMKEAFAADLNLVKVDAKEIPNQLTEKGVLLAFPIIVIFIIFQSLDSGRVFFEKNKYHKIVTSIYLVKVVFILLFITYMVFLFRNGRI